MEKHFGAAFGQTAGIEPGVKVTLKGHEGDGFAEIASCDGSHYELRFFTSPVNYQARLCRSADIRRAILPAQSRCFQQSDGESRFGRVLAEGPDSGSVRNYLVQFPNHQAPVLLKESDFHVRSYLAADDPLEVLAALANETPFFFENRTALLRALLRQYEFAHGLPALLSSKIDLLPHQVQIAGIVLRDSAIRYLLADEVGLGKTIEAGIIMRQLQIDAPGLQMAAFVPDQLVRQWRDELDHRFELTDVAVFGHSALPEQAAMVHSWDLIVIDEAHRAVAHARAECNQLSAAVAKISRASKHLLLLSATPVLHHDAELLALLELLDPENYSTSDLASFRIRTGQRILLGRAFIALRNATLAPLIKMNARKLAELLPEDPVVQQFAGELATPSVNVAAVHRELHSHISETYRIHRRLLRTRRRWLAESDRQFVRAVDERAETEVDEEPHAQLWRSLDEWRTEAAARVAGSPDDTRICAAEYVRLAEAIAAEPEQLAELTEEVITLTKATEVECRLLDELVDPKSADKMTIARAELVCQILLNRFRHDGVGAKYVVFCGSPECCRVLVKTLKRHVQHSCIRVADRTATGEAVGSIFSEFAHDSGRVLVTDATGEEGFNLQFARAVIFHDLPWSPMRIEQRLGRVDRIERAGRIVCFDITSGEDETLCLDEVWRRVLAEGFDIFRQSISDLQHAIEAELPWLRERAFLGGPEALASEIEPLKLRFARERESIEEQDVIDGMHSLSSSSPLCLSLAQADKEAEIFSNALIGYLQRNVGLHLHQNAEDNSLSFALPRNASPLVPADRLDLLAEMLNRPSTFFRNVAAEDFDLQLLRPGHPAVDACRDLLAWDDRGRAFAMWRKAVEMPHLKCVFRCLVHVRADLSPVIAKLEAAGWGSLHRGSLLRMVYSWFPDFLSELFLDEEGTPVSEALSELCRRPYHNAADVNLGKERAAHVRQEFGAATWRKWCVGAAEAALSAVTVGDELRRKREASIAEAAEHFARVRARLNARRRAGIDSVEQAQQALKHEQDLAELVAQILSAPVIRLDAIGAYLLSAKPFWDQQV